MIAARARPLRTALRILAPAVLISILSYWANNQGLLRGFQNTLNDLRASYAQRVASGDIVFVAIDGASLTHVGAWPWPRDVHADLLDRLTSAGARDVFFDIDFSLASNEASDLALEVSLAQAGNTYLAAFAQSATPGSAELVFNLPLPRFADQAWIAAVNVLADSDGIVRDYPYGVEIDGNFVPSVASMLAGQFQDCADAYSINFAIRPETIPILSASDVLSGGDIDAMVRGRSVVIGASALELGDLISTPIHGVLPGPMIHMLAAETLTQNAAPRLLLPELVMIALFFALLGLQGARFRSPGALLGVMAIGFVATEIGALAAFAHTAVVVPTAPLYPACAIFATWRLIRRIAVNTWVIRLQANEVSRTAELLETVFKDSSDAIVVLDETGAVLNHSRSAQTMFGTSPSGALNLPQDLVQRAMLALQANQPRESGGQQGNFACVGGVRSLDYTITVSETLEIGKGRDRRQKIATLSMRDVTVVQEQERRIAYLSTHDELTGALRRNAFLSFLDLRLAKPSDTAVLVFGLCSFGTVNAILGREVGDRLLASVVQRLERADLGLSAIARLDGNTFAAFSEASTTGQQADELARKIQAEISVPFSVRGSTASITANVGYVCVTAGAASSAEATLTHAEEALQLVQSQNEAPPRLYDPALALQQHRARRIERELGPALERQEFRVVYQPQHRVSDGTLIGSEALVRWHSAALGAVYPDEFIPIAESTGFILELGRWVLEQSLRDAQQMPENLVVCVNVSGIQMMRGDLISDIRDALQGTGLSPGRLCLELTETVLLSATDRLVDLMADIRASGVTWALDDFGTGYSSMTYLSRLPLDKIKLDKAFVMGLGEDSAAMPILNAVADLCRNLNVKLLCEGVETQNHLDELRKLDCAEAQGYFFGKPLELTEFLAHAKAQRQVDD